MSIANDSNTFWLSQRNMWYAGKVVTAAAATYQTLPYVVNVISQLSKTSQVAVFTLTCGMGLYLLKKTYWDYSVDRVITRIDKARAAGLKVGLFVGQRNDQPKPQEDGWVWFSLDPRMAAENTDYHLQMFVENTKKIYYTFDKVLVAYSVIKFVKGSPWDALQPLLKKDRFSELVVEKTKGVGPSGPALAVDGRMGIMTRCSQMRIFNNWKEEVGEDRVTEEFSLYKGSSKNEDQELETQFQKYIVDRETKRVKTQLTADIRTYLLTLFHDVELKKGAYPFWDGQSTKYWVARHPKA